MAIGDPSSKGGLAVDIPAATGPSDSSSAAQPASGSRAASPRGAHPRRSPPPSTRGPAPTNKRAAPVFTPPPRSSASSSSGESDHKPSVKPAPTASDKTNTKKKTRSCGGHKAGGFDTGDHDGVRLPRSARRAKKQAWEMEARLLKPSGSGRPDTLKKLNMKAAQTARMRDVLDLNGEIF